jgi:hypothetical protein
MPLYLSRKTLNQNSAAAAGAQSQSLIDDVTRQYQQAINPQPEPQEEQEPSWSLPSLQSLGVQDHSVAGISAAPTSPSAVMSAIGSIPQRAQQAASQAADTAASWALPSLESLGVGPKLVSSEDASVGLPGGSPVPPAAPAEEPSRWQARAQPTAGEPGGLPLANGPVYEPPARASGRPAAMPQASDQLLGEIDNSSRQSFVRTAFPYALKATGGDAKLARPAARRDRDQ